MNKIPLVDNACMDLIKYGIFDARAKRNYYVKRYLLHRRVAWEDVIFWPAGLLAAGLWQSRKEISPVNRTFTMIDWALSTYYKQWFEKGMPIAVVDDLLAGETLLKIYVEVKNSGKAYFSQLSEEQIQTALDKMASYAEAHEKDAEGSFLYRPANGDRTVFVDSVGLAVPFLYRYGTVFGKQEYKELALKQVENFLSRGMDGSTGLPYHGFDENGCKYGIIGWGRAVGWLLRGMTGCLISSRGRERVGASYKAFVDETLAFQRPDGYFSWQLQAAEGPADTSATGMICTALREGIEAGVLEGEYYESALSAGRNALERSTRDGRVYDCLAECEGFSCYPQRYGAYPWSLGPALTALQADDSKSGEDGSADRNGTEDV